MSTADIFETPADIRGRLTSNWKRIERNILVGKLEFPYTVPIKTPKIKDTTFGPLRADHRKWREAWSGYSRKGVSVIKTHRNFRTFKEVEVIKSLVFQSAEDLALFLGEKFKDDLHKVRVRLAMLGYEANHEEAQIFSQRTSLSKMDSASFKALSQLLEWRRENPHADTSLRELCIEGVDSKWAESNKGVILAAFQDANLLHAAEGGFYDKTGFREDDMRALWVRVHPSMCTPMFDSTEFAYRPSEISHAPRGIKKILMIENRATFLSFFPSPDTMLVLGDGKMAVSAVRDLPWLSDLEFYYWGDLDSSGYLILDRIRESHAGAISLLMDTATLEGNKAMIVNDTGMEGAKVSNLTRDELSARNALFSRKERLEQERIQNAKPVLARHGLLEEDLRIAA